MSDSRILLDTNVLVATSSVVHVFHGVATSALVRLVNEGATFHASETVLREWYVVMTRPVSANGVGLIPGVAVSRIRRTIAAGVERVEEGSGVFETWLDLVERHKVVGKSAHDARIAAVAVALGIPRLLTFNPGDFARYPGVAALDPRAIGPGTL